MTGYVRFFWLTQALSPPGLYVSENRSNLSDVWGTGGARKSYSRLFRNYFCFAQSAPSCPWLQRPPPTIVNSKVEDISFFKTSGGREQQVLPIGCDPGLKKQRKSIWGDSSPSAYPSHWSLVCPGQRAPREGQGAPRESQGMGTPGGPLFSCWPELGAPDRKDEIVGSKISKLFPAFQKNPRSGRDTGGTMKPGNLEGRCCTVRDIRKYLGA
jgi:hypothetical protein